VNSKLTRWDAKGMGPKCDIMGELATENRKRDMKFIATYYKQSYWAGFLIGMKQQMHQTYTVQIYMDRK